MIDQETIRILENEILEMLVRYPLEMEYIHPSEPFMNQLVEELGLCFVINKVTNMIRNEDMYPAVIREYLIVLSKSIENAEHIDNNSLMNMIYFGIDSDHHLIMDGIEYIIEMNQHHYCERMKNLIYIKLRQKLTEDRIKEILYEYKE
jgi:hypothetical protein